MSFLSGEGLVVVDCSSDLVIVHMCLHVVGGCFFVETRLISTRETGVEIPCECLLLLCKVSRIMLLICCWLNINLLSSICIFLIAKVLSFIKSLDGAGLMERISSPEILVGFFFLYIVIPDSSLLLQEDGRWNLEFWVVVADFFGSSVLELLARVIFSSFFLALLRRL